MGNPVVFGTPYSTYVRTVRMVLAEKGVPYELVDVSVMGGEQKQPEHLARNPFGTVPAFAHDGLGLYETGAIIRYLDQVFPDPALTPEGPADRARMNQVISIVDYHGYHSMILQIAIQRLFRRLAGGDADEAVIATGVQKAEICLSEFERMMGGNPFLAGDRLSLADLYVVPVLHYLAMTPERRLLERTPRLAAWWGRMGERASVRDTVPPPLD